MQSLVTAPIVWIYYCKAKELKTKAQIEKVKEGCARTAPHQSHPAQNHDQTSLITGLTPLPAVRPFVAIAGVAPRKFRLPIRLTIVEPTASTAPLGASKVGVCAGISCTRNSLTCVPFHTPAVPLETDISLVKIKDHRSDSYQPRDKGDHSNRWTRMAEVSIAVTEARRISVSAADTSSVPVESGMGT